jgi:hypothetical protein
VKTPSGSISGYFGEKKETWQERCEDARMLGLELRVVVLSFIVEFAIPLAISIGYLE